MDIANVKTAVSLLRQSLDLLGRGPLDYYLQELIAAHDLLMNRFSPVKVGDRVELVAPPDFKRTPGWISCAHFMVKGALGTVREAGCGTNGFYYDVVFDNESFIDVTGQVSGTKNTIVPVEEDCKHTYRMSEHDLVVVESKHTAISQFMVNAGDDVKSPLERLRFFCSLAMQPTDWLDSEPFFQALEKQLETLGATHETTS